MSLVFAKAEWSKPLAHMLCPLLCLPPLPRQSQDFPDHHNIAIIHFCSVNLDFEKKLAVLFDFVVLQDGQYQQMPSDPA